MDGFGVIINSAGCFRLHLVRDEKDMTWLGQCIKKDESNPVIDGVYAFTPAGYSASGQYPGFDTICADGSFTLLRAPDSFSLDAPLANPTPGFRNAARALDLQSDSFCMDGFGAIQDSAGCTTLSLVRDDDDMTWTAQCTEKDESDPVIDAAYAFIPAGYSDSGKYDGFDLMCADDSFTLLGDPDSVALK